MTAEIPLLVNRQVEGEERIAFSERERLDEYVSEELDATVEGIDKPVQGVDYRIEWVPFEGDPGGVGGETTFTSVSVSFGNWGRPEEKREKRTETYNEHEGATFYDVRCPGCKRWGRDEVKSMHGHNTTVECDKCGRVVCL